MCESRACYVGNPRESFCFSSRKVFFRESFAKVGYYESLSLYTLQLVKGYRLLPPGSAGEWYRTIGSSQAAEGEPNTMVLKHLLAPAAGTA